jgi:hypothetical protein
MVAVFALTLAQAIAKADAKQLAVAGVNITLAKV